MDEQLCSGTHQKLKVMSEQIRVKEVLVGIKCQVLELLQDTINGRNAEMHIYSQDAVRIELSTRLMRQVLGKTSNRSSIRKIKELCFNKGSVFLSSHRSWIGLGPEKLCPSERPVALFDI